MSLGFSGTQINLVGRPTAGLRMNYSIDRSSVRPAEVNTTQSAVGKVCSSISFCACVRITDLTAPDRMVW
jgi:hypothetical protein